MKKSKHLLCMDFESWVVSSTMNKRNLSNDILRKLDDGYTRQSLEYVLQKLKKYNQKITFFLVFKLEELFPGLIERIIESGHEIGWHSYSHPQIVSEKILLEELNKSKELLHKYKVRGFQAPEIIFFKEGYKILKKFNFNYSVSLYGNSNNIYNFSDIYELPVSVSNTKYNPEKDEIVFPSSLTIPNLKKFHVPYGSSYFWSILGKRYYFNKLQTADREGKICNLFIHNWQLVHPTSSYYKKEYHEQIGISANPLFLPYNINVTKQFDYLLSEFQFQTCIDYVNKKTKKSN